MFKFSPKNIKISDFWSNTLSSALGSILGIVLTFGTTYVIQKQSTAAHERDAALMVIHNIDKYCEFVEGTLKEWEQADSLNMYMMAHIFDDTVEIPDSTMNQFLTKLFKRDFWAHDYSAKNIFSSNIEIWQDIEDKQFIENVGQCFSAMELIQKMYVDEYDSLILDAYSSYKINVEYALTKHLEFRQYVQEIIQQEEVLLLIDRLHFMYLNSFKAALAEIRRHNEINKQLMDVSDEELDVIFNMSK